MTSQQQTSEILEQNALSQKPLDFLNISFSNNNFVITDENEENKKIKSEDDSKIFEFTKKDLTESIPLNSIQNSLKNQMQNNFGNLSNDSNKAVLNFSIDIQKINETDFKNSKKIPNSMSIQNQNNYFLTSTNSNEIKSVSKASNIKKPLKIKLTKTYNNNKKSIINNITQFNINENKIENNLNKNNENSRYKELIKKIATQLKIKTKQPTKGVFYNEILNIEQYLKCIKKISSKMKISINIRKTGSQGLLVNAYNRQKKGDII